MQSITESPIDTIMQGEKTKYFIFSPSLSLLFPFSITKFSLFIMCSPTNKQRKQRAKYTTVMVFCKMLDAILSVIKLSITDAPLFAKCIAMPVQIEPLYTTAKPLTSPIIKAKGICTKLPCIMAKTKEDISIAIS